MEVFTDDDVYQEQILPDGHQEIIFYLDGKKSRRQYSTGEWLNQPEALVAGQTLKSYKIHILPGAKLYGIRFYPHTLFPICKIPLDKITSGVLPIDDMFEAAGFWNCITDIPEQTFNNLERYLAGIVSVQTLNSAGYQYVDYAIKLMLKNNGLLRIDDLVHRSGISVKYYDELFKKHVGITPKNLCRILKFNHFVAVKTLHPDQSLTTCAYSSGYYDQSHLIKSFRQFTDTSPLKYFDTENQISSLFSAL